MPHINSIVIDLTDRDLSRVEAAVIAPVKSLLFQMPTIGRVEAVVTLLRAATTVPICFRVGDDPEVVAVWEWEGEAATIYTFEQYRLCCIDIIDLSQKTRSLGQIWQQIGLKQEEFGRISSSPGPLTAKLLVRACRPITEILSLIAYVPACHEFQTALQRKA